MDTPTPPPASPFHKPMTLTLACVAVALSAVLPTFAALKPQYAVWNASVIGALAIFAAARLGLLSGLVLVAAAIVLKDVCLYFTTPWWQPYLLSWLYFGAYAVLGWVFMRKSASVCRAAATGLGASLLFFLVSNYVSWVEQAYPYGYSLQGLLDCYVAGIPFFRGTLIGDVGFTVAFFGAHAILSRVWFPLEQVRFQKIEERI